MNYLITAIRNFFMFLVAMLGICIGILLIPFHIVYRAISPKYTLCYYFYQTAVAGDELVGSLWFGSKHTVSAIVGAKAYKGYKIYQLIAFNIIDKIFGKNHSIACAIDEGLLDKELRDLYPYNPPPICSINLRNKWFIYVILILIALLIYLYKEYFNVYF